MNRRFPGLWIPLLAALVATSLLQRSPSAWTRETILGSVDAAPAVGFTLPGARLQAALQPRAPIDRHPGQPWALLAAGVTSGIAAPHRHRVSAETLPGLLSKTARHYPLFPTGPPSYS
ncbi:MAG TPA: hypothetical protein VFX42_01850 [Gemmatimonadales bacterium]|nr:hypothetical protein [Gemmatimonadales bacterium]